ncbi:30S ribosomal protein S3 [Candidatus Nanosalina sp. VS9-1]|uniref:30S ribosomal protein S3 n=1 Tax=Candidatus Nanosalina sp. VS9-1 TaxID=3388566 RepID=UPI0039E042D8
MKEKQFIQKGARKVRLDEFLEDELEGAGYSHSDIVRTPTSTKVVIYAQRPGLVIGRGGSRINELTDDMEEAFDFENPQIEVNEIENGDANAEIVAKSIADWLQKGGHAKRVGYTYLRRMKEAGVIGAELEITGKLSGNRGRTEKFSFGYVKRCGNTSKKNVSKAYELARTKPGAIGVKVRIMESLPEFQHRKIDVNKEIFHETISDEDAENKSSRIEEVIEEAENMTSAELQRAIEEKEETIETSDIEVDEVRDAFEAREDEEQDENVEEEASDEEDESKADEEAPEEDTEEAEESEGDEAEYEEIVSGTISDAKDMIDELDDPDYGALLQAEKAGKNRKTFTDWLESQNE